MFDMLEKISNNLELSKKNYTKWGQENRCARCACKQIKEELKNN